MKKEKEMEKMRKKGKGTNRHKEEEYSWSSLHECHKEGRIIKGTRQWHGIPKNKTEWGQKQKLKGADKDGQTEPKRDKIGSIYF